MIERYGWVGRLWLVGIATIICLMPLSAQTSPTIVPVHVAVSFTSTEPERNWSVPIKGPDGRTLYLLSYDRDFWVGGELEAIDLVLRRASGGPESANLLEPAGNWHGPEPFMFDGWDFAKSPQQSIFGAKRTLAARGTNLVVRVIVVDARVTFSPNPSVKSYALDDLDLDIRIENRAHS